LGLMPFGPDGECQRMGCEGVWDGRRRVLDGDEVRCTT
jgi:hypothetical protein